MNGRFCAAYVTRIRIRVRAGEAVIVREGSGAGESNAATPGQAHEFAAKTAETDATKRAFMTFGNAFGLSLYGGTAEARARAVSTTASAAPERAANSKAMDNLAISPNEAEEPEHVTSMAEEGTAANPVGPAVIQPSLPVTLPGPDWPQISPQQPA